MSANRTADPQGDVAQGDTAMWKKILAQVCRGCPVCTLRRRYPESAYARFMVRIERHCPFCKAYDSVYAVKR